MKLRAAPPSLAGNTATMATNALPRSGARAGVPGFFGRRTRLGSIAGFEVAVDASWLFLAMLVTWSLAVGYFPQALPGLASPTYWLMGVFGAFGLFASIVLHELSHSLVARRHGMEMKGITLFIFGGVAQMGAEPPNPRAELLISIAGPIASVLIGGLFLLASTASAAAGAPMPLTVTLRYLATINWALAAFNLIPAFPLDGGRVLRAVLWHMKHSLRRATRISSWIGSAFGIGLMVLGALVFFRGMVVSGMWWFLIGMFVRGAARMSYQQLLLREGLAGEPVSRFMRTDLRTVPSHLPVSELVDSYFFRDYYKMYPVVDNGELRGCVTIDQVKAVPREEWPRRTVGELAGPCTVENTVRPNTDAVDALGVMSRGRGSRLLVTEGGRLVGIVTLADLLQFLSMKVELEER